MTIDRKETQDKDSSKEILEHIDLEKMPKEEREEVERVLMEYQYSGPLPHPQVLREYENI